MNTVSKNTRVLYRDIRSEFIKNHIRLEILRRFFTSQDTVDLLNKTAPIFFDMLKYAMIDMIVLSIHRLNDPPESKNSRNRTIFHNVSLRRLIKSLDETTYPQLKSDLKDIFDQIWKDSRRISNWRNKLVGHRDYDVLIGQTSPPTVSLIEVDKVMADLGEFLNKFEQDCYDPNEEWHINPDETDEQNAENLKELEQLRIHPPTDNGNPTFLEDSANLLRLIE